MTGIAEIVANGGIVPEPRSGIIGNPGTKRRRGLMQGLFIFLLSFLIVPIITIISIALDIEPYAVVLSALVLGVGGLLRIAYAFMFESAEARPPTALNLPPELLNRNALPPSHSTPASAYTSPTAGSWRDTNDLQREPASVTDTTTKLLRKDEVDQ